MKLTYIYHSCYLIEGDNVVFIFDYYKDTDGKNNGLVHQEIRNSIKPIYVFSSHAHPDHFNPGILNWKNINPDIRFLFSRDIEAWMKTEVEGISYLDKSEEYNDRLLYVKAYGSTDIGISFYIETEGKRIFHAGDLNNWHWNEESTSEESKECENNFLKEMDFLMKDVKSVDLAMFPVDPRLGKDYMRGAEQFIDRIETGCFAPMHFGNNYKEAAAFRPIAEAKGCRYALWTFCGQSIDF